MHSVDWQWINLKKAAGKRWPDAVITNSGIVPALPKIAARQTLDTKKG